MEYKEWRETLCQIYSFLGSILKAVTIFYINGSVKNVIKFTFFSRQIQALMELTWSPKTESLKELAKFSKTRYSLLY